MLPFDSMPGWTNRPKTIDRDAKTMTELRAAHAGYFKSMDEHVIALNKKFGKQTLFVVPAGQAVLGLRDAFYRFDQLKTQKKPPAPALA